MDGTHGWDTWVGGAVEVYVLLKDICTRCKINNLLPKVFVTLIKTNYGKIVQNIILFKMVCVDQHNYT